MKDKVLVTPEHYNGKEEWYIPVITCPNCGHKNPAIGSKFCNNCGIELKFSTTIKKWMGLLVFIPLIIYLIESL